MQHTRASSSLTIALSGLLALALAMGIGRFAFTPLLPMMQSDTGLSIAAGGWLASSNYVGYLLGSLSAIRLQWQPATAVRTGLLAVGISTLLMGCVSDLSAWIALRALAGVASAWVLIFGSAWCLERLAAARRGSLGGVVFGGVGFGITLAGLICLVLMQAAARSSSAWIILGVLCLALTALVWRIFVPLPTAALSGAGAIAPGASVYLK